MINALPMGVMARSSRFGLGPRHLVEGRASESDGFLDSFGFS